MESDKNYIDSAFTERFKEEWDKARKTVNPNVGEPKEYTHMLTYMFPDGTWGMRGYDIKQIPQELYGALCKLRDYEKTGYQPNEIPDISQIIKNITTSANSRNEETGERMITLERAVRIIEGRTLEEDEKQ